MKPTQSSTYILFDFDGTIVDTIGPALDIYNRIAPEYNSALIDEEGRRIMSGGRPQDLLKLYNMSSQKLAAIVLRLRKELRNQLSGMKPVTGILETIELVRSKGYLLGIVTSNARSNVQLFLKNNGMDHLFDFVYSGKSLFGKDRVFKRVFLKHNISRDKVIYIGDETRDIEACKKVGIPIISVTWGLNNKEILSTLHPDQMAHSPQEIIQCVEDISPAYR